MEQKSESINILIKEVGKSIGFWRKVQGYNQENLAQRLGVTRPYVARIEGGHTGISLDRIEKIGRLLNVSPFTLLRGIPSDGELRILEELFKDPDKNITTSELEDLFSFRIKNQKATRDFYLHMLSIIRSGVFTQQVKQ